MRFFGGRRARAISALLTLGLLGYFAHVTRLWVNYVAYSLGPSALAYARQASGRWIEAGRIEYLLPGRIRFSNLRVARGTSRRSGMLFAAREAELRYDPSLLGWGTLLRRSAGGHSTAQLRLTGVRWWTDAPHPRELVGDADEVTTQLDLAPLLDRRPFEEVVASIGRVDVRRPRVRLVRGPDGRWSYTRWLRAPRARRPSPFRGEVAATGAEVLLEDYRAGLLPAPARNTLRGSLLLQWAGRPRVLFTARGSAGTQPFDAVGHVNPPGRSWVASVHARTTAIPYWLRYLGKSFPRSEIQRGTADVALLLASRDGSLDYRSDVRVRDGVIRYREYPDPAREVSLRLHLVPGEARFTGTGRVSGVPAGITGRTTSAGTELAVTVTEPSLRTATLRRALEVPLVRDRLGRARLPDDLRLPERMAVRVRADGWLLPDGRPSDWSARGTAAVERASLRDEIRLEGVRATFQARMAVPRPVLSGRFSVARAQVRGQAAEQGSGSYSLADGMLQATGAGSLLGGRAEAQIWLATGEQPARYYLIGRLKDLRLVDLPTKPGSARLGGSVSADLVSHGTFADPRAAAEIRGTDLRWNDERVDTIAGRVRFAGGVWELRQLAVVDGRGSGTVRGRVERGGRMDLEVAADGIDLSQAFRGRLAEIPRGTAYVRARVTGTQAAPRVRGRLQVYRPAWRGYEADYLEAGIRSRGTKTVRLRRVRLVRGLSRLNAAEVRLEKGESGEWTAAGEAVARGFTLAGALRLGGVSAERLAAHPVAGALGPVRLSFSGPVTAPRVAFAGALTGGAVRGLDLGTATFRGEVEWQRRLVRLEELRAASSLGTVLASGTVQLAPAAPDGRIRGDLDLSVVLGGIRVRPLLREYVPHLADYASVRGMVSRLEARVQGSLEAPRATVRATLADLMVNGQPVVVLPIEASWNDGRLTVPIIEARGVGARLQVLELQARAGRRTPPPDASPRLHARVELSGLPLEGARLLAAGSPAVAVDRDSARLRRLIEDWTSSLRGTVSASAEVGGAGEDGAGGGDQNSVPFAASIRIPDLRVEGAAAETSGTLEVRLQRSDGTLRLESAALGLGDAGSATAGGVLRGPKGEVDLQVAVRDLRLGALAELPRLREALQAAQPLDGRLRADGTITGTTRSPRMQVEARVDGPVAYGIPLQRVEAEGLEYHREADGRGSLALRALRLLRRRPQEAEPAVLTLSGSLPLTPDLAVAEDRDRKLVVDLPRQSLGVLTELAADVEAYARISGEETAERVRPLLALFRQVAATRGSMRAHVTLAGTLEEPNNDGFVEFTDGILALDNLETQVRALDIRLRLRGREMLVDRCYGESSLPDGGHFLITGSVRLGRGTRGAGPELNLACTVEKFKFVQKKVGNLVASLRGTQVRGTLRTVEAAAPARPGSLSVSGPVRTPLVAGGARLDDATLLLAFRDLIPRRPAAPPAVDPELDVRLYTGADVQLQSAGARMKLDGMLHARDRLSAVRVAGDLRVSRGSFTLPTLRIRNVEGLIRVAYDGRPQSVAAGTPPVYLDLAGTTRMRLARALTGETESYEVTIEVRGRLGGGHEGEIRAVGAGTGLAIGSQQGLVLTVRSDPPLPSNRIEALIRQQLGVEGFATAGANVERTLAGQIEQALAVSVGSVVTGRFEDLIQRTLGLSVAAIDLGLQQPLRVQLGRRLFGRLYGTVTQAFGSESNQTEGRPGPQRSFEIYYRLNPRLRVGYRNEQPFPRDEVLFFSGSLSF